MKMIFAFFMVPLLFAQIEVIGVTSTQAVLRYISPDSAACTITSVPAILDIDASVFASANNDLARSTTIVDGLRRTVVLGAQQVESGTDAKRYSRALFAERSYAITATCAGAVTRTGSFSTSSPVIGAIPSGHVGWPTIDPVSQSAEYADPWTGVPFRLFGRAGDGGLNSRTTLVFAQVLSTAGSWTSLANAITAGSSFATSSGAAALVVYPDPNEYSSMLDHGWRPNRVIEDIGVYLSGAGASATAEDRQVGLCLSVDGGANCYSSELTATLPQTTATTQTVPSGFPQTWFAGWGLAPRKEHFPVFGSVTLTSGTGVISPSVTARLSPWMVGRRIFIAGTSPTCTGNLCTIATITSSVGFTTTESATATGAFYVLSLGVRVRKLNATSTVTVSTGYRTAAQHPNGQRAETNLCSPVTFVAGDGKTMRLCAAQLQAAGSVAAYAVATDGTVNYLGLGVLTDATSTAPNTNLSTAFGRLLGFSPTNAKRFYILMNGNDSVSRVYRGDYAGNGARVDYVYAGGVGGDLPASPSDQISWTVQTDLTSALSGQTHYSIATYGGAAAFTGNPGLAISGDRMVLQNAYAGAQDRIGWIMTLSLATGAITSLVHTLNGEDGGAGTRWGRWCGIHSAEGLRFPTPFTLLSCNYLAVPSSARNSGPWTLPGMQVRRSGTYSNNTALPWPIDSTYDNACPGDLPAPYPGLGATGTNCFFLRVTGEPVNGGSGGQDAASLQVGDLFANLDKRLAIGDTDHEHFRVTRKTSLGGGAWELVVQREAMPDFCNFAVHGYAPHQQHSNGWRGFMVPGITRGCSSWLAFVGVDEIAEPTRDLGVSHFTFGSNPAGDVRFASAFGVQDGSISLLSQLPIQAKAHRNVGWASLLSTVQNQSYIQVVNGKPPVLDMAALNPTADYTVEVGDGIQGTVTTTLVTGNIYKMSVIGSGSYKRSPLVGWSGRFTFTERSSAATSSYPTLAAWEFCHAFRAEECRAGSVSGEIYVNLPVLDAGLNCRVGASAIYAPCIVWASPTSGFGFQRGSVEETNAETVQKISTVNGPWHYVYSKIVPLPGGEWAQSHGGRWTEEGWFAQYLFKLPQHRPTSQSNATANGFVPVVISGLAPGSVVEFGYTPSFHCTARAEVCKVSAATITQTAPFSFAHETLAGSSGSVIAIPTQPGRVLYYRVVGGQSQAIAP